MASARDVTPEAHLHPEPVRRLAQIAIAALAERFRRQTPALADQFAGWAKSLLGQGQLSDYYVHREAFPMLLLPWWAESLCQPEHDLLFQGRIVRATIAGYYFVRMIDNLMDGVAVPPAVVPALIVLYGEFQSTYRRVFPSTSPFWRTLEESSFAAAETASADAGLGNVDEARFYAISARKISGGMVALGAVCHRYGRPEMLPEWSSFLDLFGRWHQMRNDVGGWGTDLAKGRATYLLSEAKRRRGALTVTEWILGEGIEWALGEMRAWMRAARDCANRLQSAELLAYLEQRDRLLAADFEAARPGLEAARRQIASARGEFAVAPS